MADQIAINVRVIDSEVGPKLRAVRDQIKGAFADAERSAKGLGQTNATVLKSFEALKLSALGSLTGHARFGAQLEEGGAGARKLVEGLHGLEPLLGGIGLGFANLRGFAAAARFGLVGFAAVAGGAVAVGLEKAADKVEQVKKNVTDLGGSAADFETLRKGARDLGVDIGTLGGAYDNFAKARGKAGGGAVIANPFGPQGERAFPGASPTANLVTLAKAFQLGAGNIEGGSKDLQTFTQGIAKTGRLTAETAEGLSAGSARQLEKLFGLAEPAPGSRLTPQQQLAQQVGPQGRSVLDLQTRLTQAAPRIDKDFAAKPIDLGDGFSRLKSSVEALLPSLTGLGGAAASAADALNRAADRVDAGHGPPSSRPQPAGRPQHSSGFAHGGVISGPGTGTSDSILAFVRGRGLIRVSNGEGIVSEKGMKRIGLAGLKAINGYADGGLVDKVIGLDYGGFNPNDAGPNPNDGRVNPNNPRFNANDDPFNANNPRFNANNPRFNANNPRFNANDDPFNANNPRFNANNPRFNANNPRFNANDDPFNANNGGLSRHHPIHLHIGGNTYPAMAEESVAERLAQEAINYQIASGGRRQSSIG